MSWVEMDLAQQPRRISGWGRSAYRGGRARAALGVLDVCAGALGQLLEQKGPLYPELLDLALYPGEAQAGGIVCVFDLVCAVLELNAFAAVCLFDRGRQRRRDGWRGVSIGQFSLGRHGCEAVSWRQRGHGGGEMDRLDGEPGQQIRHAREVRTHKTGAP